MGALFTGKVVVIRSSRIQQRAQKLQCPGTQTLTLGSLEKSAISLGFRGCLDPGAFETKPSRTACERR